MRGKAINKLIDAAEKKFLEREDELLSGTFDTPLLEAANDDLQSKLKNIKKEIKSKVYNCQEVLSIEVAGYDVVSGLLSEFVPAVNDGFAAETKPIRRKPRVHVMRRNPPLKSLLVKACSR